MYVSAASENGFSEPKRFTMSGNGDDTKFKKGGESAVSASKDGKTLYIYREGNIYEADLKDRSKGENKLPNTINFSYLQGYAYLSSDQKMLLFTSEAENGRGGTDIYISVKGDDGKWADPKIMPYSINTIFNEDAPFLAEDGTLYFASNGLPGYGGYDIYKTRFKDGEWTTPENLGQPINTPGDDIYFVLNPNSSKGYYASNRPGGYGDMDIYSVNYKTSDIPECTPANEQFVITTVADATNSLCYNFKIDMPEWYKANVRSVTWKINNEEVAKTASSDMTYTFKNSDNCKVYAKIIAYCDTCPSMIVRCVEKEMFITQPIIAYNTPEQNIEPATSSNKEESTNTENKESGKMNNDRLNTIGWNMTPAFFDYDNCTLREDSKAVLDQNISVLKKNPELTLVINGYADSRGTDAYNKNLSAKRANCVKTYLIERGISKYRITSINAFGESMIENGCTNDMACDEQQHQMNRKVDFNVSNNNRLITSVFLH